MSAVGACGGDIFLVDDDAGVRAALSAILTNGGYTVTGFADGETFLQAARKRAPACILLDIFMPGRTGVDILRDLGAHEYPAPILIMSGQGDIPLAVETIRNGALDFIEKPIKPGVLLDRIGAAIEARGRRQKAAESAKDRIAQFRGREFLSAREIEVLDQILSGATSKEAGRNLGVSHRTVEVHRTRIMDKLGAKNLAELMRIVLG